MGFSLRDKFNEATAQLNVFDGGKSAVTVRNNRQAQAAQTLRKKQEDEATMKMLQQKASQRNFQKLQSGQIDRPTYENQMGVIARNGNDPLVAPKLSLPQQAGKVVGTLNTGFQRSIAGLGESLGGAYDLVTPGTGVNRFTKNFTTAGQLKDIEAKQNGYNQALYKAGQLGGEAVQMFATGGVANALSKAPKVAAVTTKLASRVPAITGAGKLATAGRFITRPDVASNIATNVIQGSGFRTARGIDNNVGNVALDIGVTTALAGGLPIAGKAIQSGYRKLAPVAQQAGLKAQQFTNFTDNMVNTLSDFADYKRGDYTPDAQTLNTLIRQARAVARAGGIDITSGSPVDINNRIADWIEQTNAKKFKDGFVQIGGGKDAPQVGKTDISNAENFVKGRSLQEFNNFLTVNNGSAKKSQIIQEIKSQYGSTENFWRVMNGKEQTKSFARGELGLNSQPTLKKPVAQVGKTDPLEALKAEARKYKSAEEFVKAAETGNAPEVIRLAQNSSPEAKKAFEEITGIQAKYKAAGTDYNVSDIQRQALTDLYNNSTTVAQVGKTNTSKLASDILKNEDIVRSVMNGGVFKMRLDNGKVVAFGEKSLLGRLGDSIGDDVTDVIPVVIGRGKSGTAKSGQPRLLIDEFEGQNGMIQLKRALGETDEPKTTVSQRLRERWGEPQKNSPSVDTNLPKAVSSDSIPQSAPQVGKTEAPTVPDKYLKEYANMLRSFDDEASGGQMIPTADGGYKRISEHSPFYRDYFAEKGRKPSGKDYLEYAKNNIENDKDFMDYVAQKIEEDKLPKPISNRPSGKMSVAEKESLFSQVPQGTDKQIKISKPSGTKNIKVNKLVANEDLPLYETKKVSTADKVFRSTRSIIERQGESGKQLAGLLQKSRDTEELFQADVLNRLKTVRSLKGKEYENFVDATQGLAKPESAKVQQAIKEWKAVHPEMRQRAVDAGLDVGDLGETYYPHFVDYEKVFKDKNTYNQALNHLVKTGQAKNVEDAIQLLGYARDVSRNRKFGNLEASRLVDIPFYDKTKNSLVSYIQGTSKRIAQTETFGAKDEVALKYIADAGKQGYDTEAMKNAYDVAVGAKQYNPNTKAFSNKMRQYNSTTRLGQGALTNMTQNANTGIVTGHLRTMGAMLKQLDPKTRKFVESTGTISDGVINDLREGAGFTGKVLSKITAPGFSQVEKFNRSVAATAGRDYAQSLARKGDVATLQKLGVTGKIGKELTEAQQIQAARKIVEKTQFKVDPQDLPGWVDSPGGKLVAQFRTFSYSQSKFFSNEILKPASKGNLMPLARLLAVIPAGYAMAEVKRVLNNRPEEDNKARKGIEAFGNVGGAGLAVDMFRSMVPLNNKYLPADRRVSMAVGTFGGPTAGAAAELVGAVSEVAQRKNVPEKGLESNKVAIANNGESYSDATQLARLGLRQIPIVGTRLQNTLVPYKSNETKLSEQVKKEKDSATGLTKLSDGKYVAVINGEKKTFDNEQKAKKAISINDFMNSNDKTKEIDGKVYYKNDNTESGYSVKNKAEWDYDKSVNGLDLAIDKAKASNDLKGWMDAANKKYQALIKKRDSYDPETEFDKIDTVNKQLLNLEQEASKYSSNGYIKKPKTTSKKDSKSGNFNYKFFGFGSDPISTTKSLRQLLKEATLS